MAIHILREIRMAVPRAKQRGAIVIMTVFFVIILLGFAALALDLGRLYVLRTDMQNAADAASLAAAVELDGKLGARERAVQAATNLLSHKGQFTTSPELLTHLVKYWNPAADADPTTNPFVFFSWIGAEPDSLTPPSGCDINNTIEPGKCITTNDEEARYVKIKLDPELTPDEDKDYGIDFYFLPVLSILGGTTITEGFTKVMAVAGNTDSAICNYPPLMICGTPDDFTLGQQVRLKTQGPSSQWLPGMFAFLEPIECNEDGTVCTSESQLNKALGSQLALERDRGCSPNYVIPLPGDRQATAYPLNTRFGLYSKTGGVTYDDDLYPSSSNVIEYPMDANLDADPTARLGNGDWGAQAYFDSYHGGTTPPGISVTSISRFQTYYWEQHGLPADWNDIYHNLWEEDARSPADFSNMPTHTSFVPLDDPVNPPSPANEQCRQRPTGDAWDHPNNTGCLNLTGDPREIQQFSPPPEKGVAWEDPNRRVWFVAMLNCAEHADDINNRKPVNVLDDDIGIFAKFFITQHVQKGPPTEILAEYLGPATEDELDLTILIHNTVQLYE